VLSRQIVLHGRLLFRVAYGVLHDTGAAEDVVQDTLLKAWSQRDAIRNPAAMQQWLVRSVMNGALAVLRRRKVEKRVLQQHRAVAVGDGISVSEQLELRDSLLHAVDALPQALREVIVLRILQELSGNEVKALLGCSASEVSRHLHRGLEQLRSALSESDMNVVKDNG
jgi:RNA polymerase sigma-70 factor, ECF subfamily